MFSLYMNDLVNYFDVECDPVDLNGKAVSCLLYADDIVLLSPFFKSTKQTKTYLFLRKYLSIRVLRICIYK
jgi:hypothetical protein